MRVTRRDLIAGGVVVRLFSVVLALTVMLTQTHAQGIRQQQAHVSAELSVPLSGFPALIRIEDSEYKIVCYWPQES